MRVLVATPSLGIGGAERLVVVLAHGLARRGHEIVVCAPRGALDADLAAADGAGAAPSGASPISRVVLREHGRSPAGALRWSAGLARAIRRLRPDVVHAHNVKVAAEAGAAARLARGPRRPPVLATFHGVLPAEYRASARLLRAADRVACVSADLADGLVAAGLSPDRLTVVANGVAPGGRATGLPAGVQAPVVLAVGRLVAQKNHERLLLAARRVRERGVAATFLIAGDGPLREPLTARARALGLADAVRMLGARDDARELMAAADLVAFSSDWEGLSVAALEALAAGTPVVSTPVEGMRELLGAGAGALTDSFAPEELGDVIAELLADERRRAEMAAAGRRLIAERYSLEAMLDGYERLYRELAVSARRGRAASRGAPVRGGRRRSAAP